MGIPATDAPVRIYYAHFIKDFTITVTEAEGTTTIYTKDDAILYKEDDYYLVYIMSNSDETFIIEGEGFVPYEGEVSPNIDIYLKPSNLYAYTKDGVTMYAWTVLDTDTINPTTYKTIYTTTPTIETGMQITIDNAYVLVDGKFVNVSLSDIVSINGTGGELYVTESNNEYIEMKLSGAVAPV